MRQIVLIVLLALLLVACGSSDVQTGVEVNGGGDFVGEPSAEMPVEVTRVVEVEGETVMETAIEIRPAEEPVADEPPAGAAPAEEYDYEPEAEHPASPPRHESQQRRYEPVTAGVVDDNERWGEYVDYLRRTNPHGVVHRDVSERYIIEVRDRANQPVHDARVQVLADGRLVFEGRSDAGGRLLFHPRLHDAATQSSRFTVVAGRGGLIQEASYERAQPARWLVTLPGTLQFDGVRLDLLFLIDATGSMGDEIDKLKATMDQIALEIDRLPAAPDVRYGLVAYRDVGDEFITRRYRFTPDLDDFRYHLDRLQAAGGGDQPEDLNRALHESVRQMEWRGEGTVRLILLVADAPPHMDYGTRYTYATELDEAIRRGIKLFPIGASGLDESGAYVFRQLAQQSGGKFVFLTYADGDNPASGPGFDTTHDVASYTVDTLDRLVVNLVRDELARLPRQ